MRLFTACEDTTNKHRNTAVPNAPSSSSEICFPNLNETMYAYRQAHGVLRDGECLLGPRCPHLPHGVLRDGECLLGPRCPHLPHGVLRDGECLLGPRCPHMPNTLIHHWTKLLIMRLLIMQLLIMQCDVQLNCQWE